MATKQRLVIGIDVGTGSARAGVFDLRGRCHGHGAKAIRTWRPAADFVEQSSDDIWRSCGAAVRAALREAGASASQVAGVSFDATCSLVCLDRHDKPLTISPSGRHAQNVVVWMDHRAIDQVRRINATRHKVLRYVGGVMSPEMQPPKLLWIKENLPGTWKRAGRFLDLPDFLTYRATGSDVRSLCTTVCKWTYQGHLSARSRRAARTGRWDDGFWRQIRLGDLIEDNHERIGRVVRPMGEPIGSGLTATAARELGLAPGTAVGVGIIDAHAGGLGMIGAPIDGKRFTVGNATRRLALIGGTSTCHMAVSRDPQFVPGVWGPYFSAMVPGLWLTEGGQSATGSLVDHCIQKSRHAKALARTAKREGRTVYELLNDRLRQLAGRRDMAALTERLHVLGYHHGNRSPRADPLLRGMVSGLKLEDTIDALAREYLATIQAVAHGTRHIIEVMNRKGFRIDTIIACGGGTKNPVFLQQHADVTGCAIHLPQEPEAVLLGTAVLASVACRAYPDCLKAMAAMTRTGRAIKPARGRVRAYHDRKHRVFRRMYEHQVVYDDLMRNED